VSVEITRLSVQRTCCVSRVEPDLTQSQTEHTITKQSEAIVSVRFMNYALVVEWCRCRCDFQCFYACHRVLEDVSDTLLNMTDLCCCMKQVVVDRGRTREPLQLLSFQREVDLIPSLKEIRYPSSWTEMLIFSRLGQTEDFFQPTLIPNAFCFLEA
jgi:hypothetical protein